MVTVLEILSINNFNYNFLFILNILLVYNFKATFKETKERIRWWIVNRIIMDETLFWSLNSISRTQKFIFSLLSNFYRADHVLLSEFSIWNLTLKSVKIVHAFFSIKLCLPFKFEYFCSLTFLNFTLIVSRFDFYCLLFIITWDSTLFPSTQYKKTIPSIIDHSNSNI